MHGVAWDCATTRASHNLRNSFGTDVAIVYPHTRRQRTSVSEDRDGETTRKMGNLANSLTINRCTVTFSASLLSTVT